MGQNIIIGFNSLFEDSNHLETTCKSLHATKIQRRTSDNVSSDLRHDNAIDQTTEHRQRAMFTTLVP